MWNKTARLTNVMEEIVDSIFDKTLEDVDICKCEQCRLDIIALALNSLTPRYAISDHGRVMTKVVMMESQHQADVVTALTNASKVVSKNPKCGNRRNY